MNCGTKSAAIFTSLLLQMFRSFAERWDLIEAGNRSGRMWLTGYPKTKRKKKTTHLKEQKCYLVHEILLLWALNVDWKIILLLNIILLIQWVKLCFLPRLFKLNMIFSDCTFSTFSWESGIPGKSTRQERLKVRKNILPQIFPRLFAMWGEEIAYYSKGL